MNNQRRVSYCPICHKEQKQEFDHIAHIVSSHKSSKIVKRLNQLFELPPPKCKCPVCDVQYSQYTSLISHFKNHPREFFDFKMQIGFDLEDRDNRLVEKQKLRFLKDFQLITLYYFPEYVEKIDEKISEIVGYSNFVYRLDLMTNVINGADSDDEELDNQSNDQLGTSPKKEDKHLLFIGCSKGIILTIFPNKNIEVFFEKLNKNLYYVIGSPEEIFTLQKYNLPHLANTNIPLLSSPEYVTFIKKFGGSGIFPNDYDFDVSKPTTTDAKLFLQDFATVHAFLLHTKFYKNCDGDLEYKLYYCPECQFNAYRQYDIYLHLFRIHQTTSYAMSLFKKVENDKHYCEQCNREVFGFNSLMKHVLFAHQKDLFEKALIDAKKDAQRKNDNLISWLEDQLQHLNH
ncbi:hypothetical protein TRFO_36496 [Tritrichomonas foetus]|uniref:C2H2-type domain-containing protein n=1 Tax=Tritrichomonas foetus TaxID=1144522 RepID=A0A1J4JF89_9EUKA|nr:hypothetical protein TRFO_36496 [Tritrichomonas foetus]|eukprot:OHS97337.1 hypothetical protein TRFO_36496 [Tritrichomonas foetus]